MVCSNAEGGVSLIGQPHTEPYKRDRSRQDLFYKLILFNGIEELVRGRTTL